MVLWIRSQDKKQLIKVKCITIEDDKIYADNGNHTYHILGYYSTEKQALEVLDEIENIMVDNREYLYDECNNTIGYVEGTIIYQMPEDKGENYGN